MEKDNKNKIDHYKNVVYSLNKELEAMIERNRERFAESKNPSVDSAPMDFVSMLSDDDIDLLVMSRDLFNEFLEDFFHQIDEEEKQKIIHLNNLVNKMLDIHKRFKDKNF